MGFVLARKFRDAQAISSQRVLSIQKYLNKWRHRHPLENGCRVNDRGAAGSLGLVALQNPYENRYDSA